MRRFCVVALLVLLAPPFALGTEPRDQKSPGLLGTQPAQLVPDVQRAKISNKRAASLVKQRYSSARILGVSVVNEGGGPPIYQVRTLSPNGVVKSVFVDGDSGEVFE